MAKRKKIRNQNNHSLKILLPIVVIVSAIFLLTSHSSNLRSIVNDFHRNGSESNIKKFLPDASIIFTEEKNATSFKYYFKEDENRTIIYKFYYSSDANNTIIACDRNVTVAICPGKIDKPVESLNMSGCVLSGSLALQLNVTKP